MKKEDLPIELQSEPPIGSWVFYKIDLVPDKDKPHEAWRMAMRFADGWHIGGYPGTRDWSTIKRALSVPSFELIDFYIQELE